MVTERVLLGEQLLDQRYPGWFRKINLYLLDIESSKRCILGQLWGDYFDGCKFLEISPLDAEDYGFDAPPEEAEELKDEWVSVIEGRLYESV
jgi:hypothetical protein